MSDITGSSTAPETWTAKRVVVMGATGGIGRAFIDLLSQRTSVEHIYAMARSDTEYSEPGVAALTADYSVPESLESAAQAVAADGPIDLVIVATGLLHAIDGLGPEKSLRDLDADKLARAYLVNTIGPALMAKHFLPLLNRDKKAVFAALSARVGSISDNRVGGWYGYRAAKAGLNQILKTASIEHARRWPQSIIVGLHPGTVDTNLSKPFQRNVVSNKLFTPDFSAGRMLSVVDTLSLSDSGKVFDWAGKEVPA